MLAAQEKRQTDKEENMRRKFNDAEKAKIIAEAKVHTQREIAEERDCSPSTISRIITEEKLKQSNGHEIEVIEMANAQPPTKNIHAPIINIHATTVNVQLIQQQPQQNMLTK